MKAVVRAWSANLNAGNNAAEARLFSLPALMIQGPYGYRLTTAAQIVMKSTVVTGCPGIANGPRAPRRRKTKMQ